MPWVWIVLSIWVILSITVLVVYCIIGTCLLYDISLQVRGLLRIVGRVRPTPTPVIPLHVSRQIPTPDFESSDYPPSEGSSEPRYEEYYHYPVGALAPPNLYANLPGCQVAWL